MLINKKLNGSFFYKIICIFALLTIFSYAEDNETRLESFFDRVIDKGVVSINTAPDLIPSLNYVPPAGSISINIDIEINRIATQLHKSPIFPGRQAKIDQMEFLKKNRNTFSKWSKKSIGKVNGYFDAHKGSLNALNNMQRFVNVIECIKAGNTQEQCAKKIILDVAISKGVGSVIGYLGLGTLATGSALLYADYKAVKTVLERYYEYTELVKDEEIAKKQKNDRIALGANVRSMESYLELMLARYETNQNILGDHLLTFWKNAEDSFSELKTADQEFTIAWEKIKNKKYPTQLQESCEKSTELNNQCNSLISFYTTLTSSPLPKLVTDISSYTNKFKHVLSTSFSEKCMGHLDNIREDIDSNMKGKVYPLYYWYKRLETSIQYVEYTKERYYSDKQIFLRRNQSLNAHYEQQLLERYGKDDDRYIKGVTTLNRIKDQMNTYQPTPLKKQQHMAYIDKRLNILKVGLEHEKFNLNSIFKDIKVHIEAISQSEENFKSTAQSKAEELSSTFNTCLNEMFNTVDACKEKFSSIIESIEKEINAIKSLSASSTSQCQTTKEMLDQLAKKIKIEKNTFAELKSQLNDLMKKMKNTKSIKEKLEENDKKINKLAKEIENSLSELGELSFKICQKTKSLNDYSISDETHTKTSQWIQQHKKELKPYVESIKERHKQIDSYKKDIQKIIYNDNTIELDAIKVQISNISTLSQEINTAVAQANQTLIQNLKNMSIIYARKQAVKKSLKSIEKECGKGFENTINKLYEQVKTITLSRCTKDLDAKIKNLQNSFSTIQKEVSTLNKQMGENKEQFVEHTKNVETINTLNKDREITLLLVKNYLLKAKRIGTDAAICVVLSEEIMKKVFIPTVVGKKRVKALRILKNAGLTNLSPRKIGEAPSEMTVNEVLTQRPETKKRVKKDTPIILTHYGFYIPELEKAEAEKKKVEEKTIVDKAIADCSDTIRQKYSDGKFYTQKDLKRKLKYITESWKKIEKKINNGTKNLIAPFYQDTRVLLEKRIISARERIAKIHANGDKQFMGHGWARGYTLKSLLDSKKRALLSLSKASSPSHKESLRRSIANTDKNIAWWRKQKEEALNKLENRIRKTQERITLWEQEAEKLRKKHLKKIQKFQGLLAEHECINK